MQIVARNLMMLSSQGGGAALPSAIFGSASGLAQNLDIKPRIRIGLWPCRSEQAPETAMGIMAVLGFLLEDWQEVRVYRIFAQLDGEVEHYEWTIAKSQFGVDDWQLEELDDNVGVWASLEEKEDSWNFELWVESDLVEEVESEPEYLKYQTATLSELIASLPKIARDLLGKLGADQAIALGPSYGVPDDWDGGQFLIDALGKLFHWERRLFLFLWGYPWEDDEILKEQDSLITSTENLRMEFGAWIISNATARAMLPGYSVIGDLLVDKASQIAHKFSAFIFPFIRLGWALHGMGYAQAAYDLLEDGVVKHTPSSACWLSLAETYRAGGRGPEALDAFQRAIEADATDRDLYMRYANLLLALEYSGWSANEFILIDPEEIETDRLIWEAIEAYQEILDSSDDVEALYQQMLQLIDMDLTDVRILPGFERLVKLDLSGDYVRVVAEALSNVEDLQPIASVLENALKERPDRVDLQTNLAVVYLLDGAGERASAVLQKARQLNDDPLVRADIDRLLLSARNPEFEMRLGELTALVGAGKSLEIGDVEFLEEAIEEVPSFAEGYLLLSNAYITWGEVGSALETLLDAHKHLPNDPDILDLLVRVLWNNDEYALAFSYLKQGLVQNPNHVPLLATTGRCLFDDGQEELARAYLAKAELISPRHPTLNEVRQHIARAIQEDNS